MILNSRSSPISSPLGTRVHAVLVRELGFRSSFPAPGRFFGLCSSSLPGLRRGNGETRSRNRSSNHENDGQGSHSLEGEQPLLGFSMLSSEIPWDSGSIWSIMGGYFFCLHIPLSFGGLPVICQILNQPVLDPQTETASLLLLQTLEVTGALALLHYSAKKRYSISSFFQDQHLSEGRSWVKAAGLGLGFLMLVVLLTSLLADRLIGSKDVSNPELREILLSFPLSRVAFFLIYCFITPVLEEAVYRGFLLTSLASAMKWQRAVVISALVFSSAHFSPENFLQLFLIGCVLGSAYCWSGNLTASFAIHSLYNAIVLLVTFSPEN
ncbi:unnamed protein product [Spirodela intermedia]|uniref:CAAX prenyl protease 2/Lysostaphin resistance protein A-like domain-containing protein n=1 Tax=Spirodela intermedia TaxID=51605 RepID=A0A7I8KQ59_SPIIN|nr:unnamed protein product [Spirodela intermedia]